MRIDYIVDVMEGARPFYLLSIESKFVLARDEWFKKENECICLIYDKKREFVKVTERSASWGNTIGSFIQSTLVIEK